MASPYTPLEIVGPSGMFVTGIPSVHFYSSPLFQNTQRGPSSFISFVQGFSWYGGHIPLSAPYVGP